MSHCLTVSLRWWGGDIDAFNNSVDLVDGGHLQLQRRERPELLHDPETGYPFALISGVSPGWQGDQTFTLIQPVGTSSSPGRLKLDDADSRRRPDKPHIVFFLAGARLGCPRLQLDLLQRCRRRRRRRRRRPRRRCCCYCCC